MTMINNVIVFSNQKIIGGNSAASSRIMKYAKLFAGENLNVYICSITTKSIQSQNIKEIAERVFFIDVPYRKAKSNNLFKNFFKAYLYIFQLVKFVKKIEGESIFILYPTSEPTIELPAIIILRWFYKFKLFCEVNELRRSIVTYFTPRESKFRNLVINLMFFLRYQYYNFNESLSRYFTGLIVISSNLEKYFIKFNNNIIRIPILADINSVPYCYPFVYNKVDKFVITFTGQIEIVKEGLDILFSALSKLQERFSNFELHLYGPVHSNTLRILKLKEEKLGLVSKIYYHEEVSHHDVLSKLKKSHLLTLIRPPTEQNSFGFSTKLSEYLLSGTPVILSDVSDNRLYMKDKINCFMVEQYDIDVIAEKLYEIIISYNVIAGLVSRNGYDTAAQFFHYERYSKSVIDFCNK